MAFIETLAPRDYSFCTLFGYPYVEGVRNIRVAIPCCSFETEHESPSLLGRVAHLILGLLLLIPIVNTIVFLVLRFFLTQTIIQDAVSWIDPPDTPDQRSSSIETLNVQRNELIQQVRGATCIEPVRSQLLSQLREVERQCSQTMKHQDTRLVEDHLAMSRALDTALTYWDGKITPITQDEEEGEKQPSVQVNAWSHFPASMFTQKPGLTQLAANNLMCGYYALFFMRQAVKEQSFSDRVAFNDLIFEWHQLIAQKRIANHLYSHREQNIPYGLEIPAHGLGCEDMQYLINHSEHLTPLRETAGCFMLEMDALDGDYGWAQPVFLLGQSKMQGPEGVHPTTFPIYFIVKELDLHYYFMYAKNPWEFEVVHSLNHDVSNPTLFNPQTYIRIIEALKGVKTPLQITA